MLTIIGLITAIIATVEQRHQKQQQTGDRIVLLHIILSSVCLSVRLSIHLSVTLYIVALRVGIQG